MPKFGTTEKSILAIALIVFLVLSYFLYDDSLLFSRGQNNKLNHIGNIIKSNNDVRRKNSDTFSLVEKPGSMMKLKISFSVSSASVFVVRPCS